jgi:hypothetical protein
LFALVEQLLVLIVVWRADAGRKCYDKDLSAGVVELHEVMWADSVYASIGQMQREDCVRERKSQNVQNRKRKKPKVVYSTRKEIEASRMRQTRTRSRVAEVDCAVPKAIQFRAVDVVEFASDIRSKTENALIIGLAPSTETLNSKVNSDLHVSKFFLYLFKVINYWKQGFKSLNRLFL